MSPRPAACTAHGEPALFPQGHDTSATGCCGHATLASAEHKEPPSRATVADGEHFLSEPRDSALILL